MKDFTAKKKSSFKSLLAKSVAIDSLPGCVCWFDLKGGIVEANNFFCEIFGFPCEDVGQDFSIFDIFDKESAELFFYNNQKVVASNKFYVFEEKIKVSSKSDAMVFLSHKSPWLDGDKLIGVSCLLQEVTHYKEVQNFLLNKKERLFFSEKSSAGRHSFHNQKSKFKDFFDPRVFEIDNYVGSIFSFVFDSFYWFDAEGYYVGCNVSGANLVGLSASKEIGGKTPHDFFEIDNADRIHKANMYVIQAKKSMIFEMFIIVDGRKSWFSVKKAPIYNDSQEVIGVFSVVTDISENKRLETNLFVAKERASEAGMLKKDFLMNISHDLRTPCSGILGFAKALQEQEKDFSKANKIECIVKSATRLLNLLNDIIDHSRQEFLDSSKVEKKQFNFVELVRSIHEILATQISNKRLSFLVDFPDGFPDSFVGDEVRIHRILLNIVTNAVKFTDEGGVSINVGMPKNSYFLSAATMVVVEVSIKDTGIGIAQDQMELIFNQFYRGSLSCNGKYEGIGMGLDLVKKMINKIDGSVKVESQLGVGTEFLCSFPLMVADNKVVESVMDASRLGGKKGRSLFEGRSDLRVLVVEDDRVSQFLARSLLSSMACSFDVVSCAQEALEKNIQDYNLVLLDIGLPDRDGFYVAKSIREKEREKELSPVMIVALTAHLDLANVKKCKEAGIDHFKNKPLTKDILQEIISLLSVGAVEI